MTTAAYPYAPLTAALIRRASGNIGLGDAPGLSGRAAGWRDDLRFLALAYAGGLAFFLTFLG